MADRVVQLRGRGARGESLADVARRTGSYGVAPTDTDAVALSKYALGVALESGVTAEADRAQDAANYAEAFSGTVFASVEDGEAATTPGQIFRVSNGDGPPETTTAYRRTSGGSVAQAPLATTAALASPGGAALVVFESGKTVQDLGFSDADKGADLVKFKLSDAGAIERSVRDRLTDTVSARDFGAIGDGDLHPLSERFATLAEAQAQYPFVTSLDQQIDWAALQAGLNAVENSGELLVPRGHYRIGTDMLLIGNYCGVQGQSRGGDDLDFGSLIESDATSAPVILNKHTGNVTFIRIANLSLKGGTRGFQVYNAVSCSFITLDTVDTRGCLNDDLWFNRLEVSVIQNCSLMSGARTGYAVHVEGFAHNACYFIANRCTSPGAGVWRAGQGCEGVHWIGGSWEAGGAAGAYAADLDGTVVTVRNVSFYCVYFEGISEYLIRITGPINNNIKFDSCKFTGAAGDVPVKFATGSTIIEFGSNFWNEDGVGQTPAPLNCLIGGINSGLFIGRSNTYTHSVRGTSRIYLKAREYTSDPTINLGTFARGSTSSDTSNMLASHVRLTVTAMGTKVGTSDHVFYSRSYEFVVCMPPGGGVTNTSFTTVATSETASSGVTITPSFSSTSTLADLVVAITGFEPGKPITVMSEIEYKAMAANTNYDNVFIPGA